MKNPPFSINKTKKFTILAQSEKLWRRPNSSDANSSILIRGERNSQELGNTKLKSKSIRNQNTIIQMHLELIPKAFSEEVHNELEDREY